MATQPPVFEIPLAAMPQTLGIPLKNVGYFLVVKWCWPIQCWILDIYDGTTLAPLVLGCPMVTGADLLEQFEYLGIGVQLIVQSDYEALAMPTFTNLGDTSHLFFMVN